MSVRSRVERIERALNDPNRIDPERDAEFICHMLTTSSAGPPSGRSEKQHARWIEKTARQWAEE